MTSTPLLVHHNSNGVVDLTLNRPEKRNALSSELIADLKDFARTITPGPKARAVVLRAAGDVFCAGGDLNWMMAQIKADRATRMVEARKLAEMLRALNEMPLPLIACIQGDAFGGGIGMAAVCDTVIAVKNARFAFTETRLGLIPATIGPYVLARLSEGAARQVFMSAKLFDCAMAKELGLVSQVVPADGLEAAVWAAVKPYLAVSPMAVQAAKSLARSLGAPINDAVIDDSIRRLADTWETDDAREGIAAFLEKRKPRWISEKA